MIASIYLDNPKFLIHSFRPEDLSHFEQLTKDIFDILSDEQTLKFIPGKRLKSLQEAEFFLQAMIVNYHSGRNYLQFIRHKELDKVIGMIDLISPEVAKEHYSMDQYPFFLEFYLAGFASGQHIITEILPLVIEKLTHQGIAKIGAVVHKENIAARKVLVGANFTFKMPFDLAQDVYETMGLVSKD
ncbi:RimJ/RimL family protein N-acetyltransferase [Pedobacter cryoconitis]|uniref:GNAT family N-acetyltransferase n=1 Tax=Pedobacter cryoconitis TaxID=188932 RepID=UPI00160BD361|nr:GNAT family N-acetyltransferase [Pedobacter cryoconitis]MBB6271894.1 RimJ/RimL family protein N-acetyltransferase [Pedobacter cryoconitis]